jgi:ubiquinone/menaquinone biosynthesis C-methylase UbiE
VIDYDATDIPAAYDQARDHGPELLALWMRATAAHLGARPITRILDLGCGTGRFSEGLAAHFNAQVIGLDPSAKMLARAREKQRDGRVHYQRGRAETIPLGDRSVDLVFMSMSLHHFSDPRGAARECHRVLRSEGSVVVRTGTRDQVDSYPYVPFFGSARPILERVLPSRAEVRDIFITAGLQPVAAVLITQTIAPDWETYARKVEAGGDSVLAQLPRQDFDEGLATLRHFAAQHRDRPVVEPIDLLAFRTTAAPARRREAGGGA